MLAHTRNHVGPTPFPLEARKRQTSPARPLGPGLGQFAISPTRFHVLLLQEDWQGRILPGRRRRPCVPQAEKYAKTG